MEANLFEKFKRRVLDAENGDSIYFDAYHWLDLDEKQSVRMAAILYKHKNYDVYRYDDTRVQIFTPVGLGIIVPERDFINACLADAIDRYFKLP